MAFLKGRPKVSDGHGLIGDRDRDPSHGHGLIGAKGHVGHVGHVPQHCSDPSLKKRSTQEGSDLKLSSSKGKHFSIEIRQTA